MALNSLSFCSAYVSVSLQEASEQISIRLQSSVYSMLFLIEFRCFACKVTKSRAKRQIIQGLFPAAAETYLPRQIPCSILLCLRGVLQIMVNHSDDNA